MPEDMELSEFDEKILGMADYMSPEQISKKLGGAVSAAKIRLQLQRLLEDVDWITEAQRENLLFRRMHMILAKLESIPGSQWDLDNLKVQLATLKELGNRFDKRRQANEVDLERYDRNVGQVLGRVVDLSLSYMKGALRAEVDADRWDELVQEAILQARSEIERHQAVEA